MKRVKQSSAAASKKGNKKTSADLMCVVCMIFFRCVRSPLKDKLQPLQSYIDFSQQVWVSAVSASGSYVTREHVICMCVPDLFACMRKQVKFVYKMLDLNPK